MALRLCDVQCDPIADRALKELMDRYTVAEEKSGLVLTEKAGNMKFFLQYVDDLHQWDFIHSQKMVNENERLRALLRTVHQQRESWKVRALRRLRPPPGSPDRTSVFTVVGLTPAPDHVAFGLRKPAGAFCRAAGQKPHGALAISE
jgi:hypothetical protein